MTPNSIQVLASRGRRRVCHGPPAAAACDSDSGVTEWLEGLSESGPLRIRRGRGVIPPSRPPSHSECRVGGRCYRAVTATGKQREMFDMPVIPEPGRSRGRRRARARYHHPCLDSDVTVLAQARAEPNRRLESVPGHESSHGLAPATMILGPDVLLWSCRLASTALASGVTVESSPSSSFT